MIFLLSIDQAVVALCSGQVVAYPTEAVYGLGCDPWNESALQLLWRLKQRPPSMGVILIASSWQQLLPFMADLSQEYEQQLKASWPAPLTWVVPARTDTPDWLTGGRTTIALRWTNHPVVSQLCDAFSGALVSTSANLHGQIAAKSAQEVLSSFENQEGFIGLLSGDLGEQTKPTPIRELLTGRWIRE